MLWRAGGHCMSTCQLGQVHEYISKINVELLSQELKKCFLDFFWQEVIIGIFGEELQKLHEKYQVITYFPYCKPRSERTDNNTFCSWRTSLIVTLRVTLKNTELSPEYGFYCKCCSHFLPVWGFDSAGSIGLIILYMYGIIP